MVMMKLMRKAPPGDSDEHKKMPCTTSTWATATLQNLFKLVLWLHTSGPMLPLKQPLATRSKVLQLHKHTRTLKKMPCTSTWATSTSSITTSNYHLLQQPLAVLQLYKHTYTLMKMLLLVTAIACKILSFSK